MTRKTKSIALVFAVAGVIVGLILSANLGLQSKAYTESAKISQESLDIMAKVGKAMVEVSNVAKPSVVNISTTRVVRMQGHPEIQDPLFRRFFGDEFFRFFGEPRERKATSLGSGVIVDPAGYILTNNHVVKEAEKITVTLSDNREFEGKVIGTDPKTDLAVVRIDAKDLPVLKWGDDEKLQVGEPVIAVGSPYGLTQTVTFGIVSAKGRANVQISDYEDFIQTDAAINPGNSGGPLINMKGELVGINTAIFSTTGGYMGIGFAIPSSMARVVMKSLIEEGRVVRGWLGVTIQPVTPEIAKQFGLKEEKGVLVSDVIQGSPAAKGGVERGDVVVEYQGQAVEDPVSLRNMVAGTKPGTKAKVKVLRGGKEKALSVEIGELPEEAAVPGMAGPMGGVHVQDLTPELRQTLKIPDRVAGVIVTDSEEDIGLRRGDVIMEVNRQAVSDTQSYQEAVSAVEPGSDVLLLVWRGGRVFYLTVPGK
ncbi:MAG: DegQ family serine endoprotease [Thermodesulfovibrionales bacterium]